MNQRSIESGPARMPMNDGYPLPWQAWYARTGGPHSETYLAVFNLSEVAGKWDVPWLTFHLSDKPHAVYNIWVQKHVPSAKELHVEIPAHGCALYRIE